MINVQNMYNMWHKDRHAFLYVLSNAEFMKRRFRISVKEVYDLLGGTKLPYRRGYEWI